MVSLPEVKVLETQWRECLIPQFTIPHMAYSLLGTLDRMHFKDDLR